MTNEQNKNINEEIIKYLDNEGDCERCGCNMCEEDWEHETRELFVSNVDGKNICRRCVREEDEAEDEGYCWKHEVAVLPCKDCENGVKCDDWEEHKCRRCKDYYDELNDDGMCGACVRLTELDEIYGSK
jgi:hypothetical protein